MVNLFAKLLLVFSISLFSVPETAKHPLHVSTTEVDFNAKEKTLEVSCRIYTDDFENILAKQSKTKIDLSNPAVHKSMDEHVKKYIQSHLRFVVNGKATNINYIGFEKDDEATNVYVEIENVTNIQQLESRNSVLYDLFDDQMNILHVTRNGNRKSARANYPEQSLKVAFQ